MENMERLRVKPRNRKLFTLWTTFIVFISVTIGTIAYSALNTTLTLLEGEAIFRPEADIRIVDLRFQNATNGGMEDYNSEYSKGNIFIGIILPEIKSTVTYEITVTNFVDIIMVLKEVNDINFNNTNMEYVLTNIDTEDTIQGVTTITFSITFKYKEVVTDLPENTSLGADIEFVFFPYDNEPPAFTEVNNQKMYFLTQSKEIDLAVYATAYDEVDGDVTPYIEITSTPELDINRTGTYKITYNVQDQAGNKAPPFSIEILIWNFVKIVNGQYYGIALTSHGQVWTWGWNSQGARAVGSTTASATTLGIRAPTVISQNYFDNEPVVDIAAGYASGYAITSAGKIYSWGDGAYYALGNNNTDDQTRPVAINLPNGVKAMEVSSFAYSAAALGNDGNIYTWGLDIYGSNGNGGNGNKTVPTAITSNGNFVQVSQGYYGGAAVNDSGEVYVWGTNLEGQLGIGNTGGYNHTPTKVTNLNNIKKVSYGTAHILALANDGQVYAWGYNGSGRLGLGDIINRNTPTLVSSLENVSQINAGYDFSQFKVGNNIYSSGYANFGELFAGNVTERTKPFLSTMNNVANNVSYIAGKFDNAYILTKDGTTLYGIGFCDASGQEWGSTVNQSISTGAVVPWTFTPP